MKLSVLRKISRSRDSPIGLYFKLNLSNRWKESECACMSNVSIDKSYVFRKVSYLLFAKFFHLGLGAWLIYIIITCPKANHLPCFVFWIASYENTIIRSNPLFIHCPFIVPTFFSFFLHKKVEVVE